MKKTYSAPSIRQLRYVQDEKFALDIVTTSEIIDPGFGDETLD